MSDEMVKRIIEEAEYISKTGATVRQTAKVFMYSKSNVHKDVADRLYLIDKTLYSNVQKVLKKNLAERHIRGGEATRLKYKKISK